MTLAAIPMRRKDVVRKVRKWMEEEKLRMEDVPDPRSDMNVSVPIHVHAGTPVASVQVTFPRASNDAITFTGGIELSDEFRERFKALTAQQKSEFLWDLRFSLLQFHVAYSWEPSGWEIKTVKVWRNVFFDGLTKTHFMEVFVHTSQSVMMVKWKFDKALGNSEPSEETMLGWRT